MMHSGYTARYTLVGVALWLGGCAGSLFQYGPRPQQLTGTWVDLSHTTATDTAACVLRGDGYDGLLHIVVDTSGKGTYAGQPTLKRRETRYGTWYLDGAISDTAHRAICYKRRVRNGGTCVRFRLDTLAGTRRLTLFGYVGEHHTGTRVLEERVP